VTIAEKYHQSEANILQESRIALLKIERFHFAMNHSGIGAHYQNEAKEMVSKALLSFVPNSFILSEEGFYYKPKNS
jgi:hypothetical protein